MFTHKSRTERPTPTSEVLPLVKEAACEYLSISPEVLEKFRSRIEQVKGHVRVAVHPLYIGRYPGTFIGTQDGKRALEVHAELVEGFKKTILSVINNPQSAPLLVFEEESHIQESIAEVCRLTGIEEQALAEHGILFVPTEESSGSLSERALTIYEKTHRVSAEETSSALRQKQKELLAQVKDIPIHTTPVELGRVMTEEEIQHSDARSARVRSLLNEHTFIERQLQNRKKPIFGFLISALSIRSALVSGGYFFGFYDQSPEDTHTLSGCAGSIVESLRKHQVATDISRFSWMDRDDLKAKGYVTKETGSA